MQGTRRTTVKIGGYRSLLLRCAELARKRRALKAFGVTHRASGQPRNWKTCLRKCLSMPPTPRKRAWLWLTEIKLKNLILNPKTDASLLEIYT